MGQASLAPGSSDGVAGSDATCTQSSSSAPIDLVRTPARLDGEARLKASHLNEWFSAVLASVWPFLSPTLRVVLINAILPKLLSCVRDAYFLHFDLGTDCPEMKIALVDSSSDTSHLGDKSSCKKLKLECQLSYKSTVDIAIHVADLIVRVRQIEFSGEMIIEASPLTQELPLLGSVRYFFWHDPVCNLQFDEDDGNVASEAVKESLVHGFRRLLREHLVAPRCIAGTIHPQFPLHARNDIWPQSVEPVGIISVQPQEIDAGMPEDFMISLRVGGREWKKTLTSAISQATCEDTDTSWMCAPICDDREVVNIEAYITSEKTCFSRLAVPIKDLQKAACEDACLEMEREGKQDNHGERSVKLRLRHTWTPLGSALQQTTDSVATVPESVGTPVAGILVVRIGAVISSSLYHYVRVSASVGRGPKSVSRTCSSPGLEPPRVLPSREQRITQRLQKKGWSPADIADLLDIDLNIVLADTDPQQRDLHDVSNWNGPDELSSKYLQSSESRLLDDVMLIIVPHGVDGSAADSQEIVFEMMNEGGHSQKETVATGSMPLSFALSWPARQWFSLAPLSNCKSAAHTLQLEMLFRPCQSLNENMHGMYSLIASRFVA